MSGLTTSNLRFASYLANRGFDDAKRVNDAKRQSDYSSTNFKLYAIASSWSRALRLGWLGS